MKVIGDYVWVVVNLIVDGVSVFNVGRGYILWWLIWWVVCYGCLIGIFGEFILKVVEIAIVFV